MIMNGKVDKTMTKWCISNDIDQIRSWVYQNNFECSAPKEQFKYCYLVNYQTLTGFEVIYND